MKFINSLRSEILKIKGSALLWLSIFGTLLIPVSLTIRNIAIGNHLNLEAAKHGGWMHEYVRIAEPFVAFILPIGAILICSLIAQVEYRNNNWKQVHTTPQSYTRIFFAKYTVLFFLAGMVFLLLLLGVFILGALPTLILDGSLPREGFPIGGLTKELLKSFIAILPIIGIQYLVSLRYANFLVSIGVGLALFVGTILVVQYKFSFVSPFSYPFYYINGNMPDLNHRMYKYAFGYFLLLTIVNYIVYTSKRQKG